MERMTSLGMGILAMRERYDATCKRVLSEKQVLARIMHDYLDEFRSVDPKTIADKYIEGDPRIGTEPVGRDAFAARVKNGGQNDETIAEGTNYFDIRFEAVVPDTADLIRIEVDVEAENRFNRSYPITRRAVYYCGRLLSQQGAGEVVGSHYERVRKVYSIWICQHAPERYRGTVTRFKLEQECLRGHALYDRDGYDLVEVIIMCPEAHLSEKGGDALEMLQILFDTKVTPADKMRLLHDEYGMMMANEFEEDVVNMCNLSESIFEQGIEQGFEQGIEQGIEQGVALNKLQIAQKLIREFSLDMAQVIAFLEVPEDEAQEFERRLTEAMA